jgi:UDP-glucuronate 4-epimerase
LKILITGTAGFIGSAVALKLLSRGDIVVGIDNHNDYYNPELKEAKISRLFFHENYYHYRFDLSDKNRLFELVEIEKPTRVIHLAAQAGVRYSLENPEAYIKSNLVAFANILECCRHNFIQHLVYASSSSVYGSNLNIPFSIHHSTNHPLSLYAATKKANELMSHSYSSLYGLPTTGLRFFTVYGPWGRPDMALFKFTKLIINGEPIQLFNNGNHKRDFTYIDDIVEGVLKVVDKPAANDPSWSGLNPDPSTSAAPWRIYNIGNGNPINLIDYISEIEAQLGIKAKINYLPLQPGDVEDTHANTSEFEREFNFKPETSIKDGISNFISWYRSFYKE